MRTLVHLSDLHFGRVDQALLEPLIALIKQIAPDLVVVSGDLTQRARTAQFQAARRFLEALPSPQIIVPGNHDISMHNIFSRFVQPLDKYQRYLTDELSPIYIDQEIAVIGINTTRSFTIKDGRIDDDKIQQVQAQLSTLVEPITKIVVTHHPLHLPSHFEEKDLVRGATTAMKLFATAKIDLLLAGHMHSSEAGITSERYKIGDFAAVAVQAGTATSTRERGESNSFNTIQIWPQCMEIKRMSWDENTKTFINVATELFHRKLGGWTPAPN